MRRWACDYVLLPKDMEVMCPEQSHKLFLEPRPAARCSHSWLGSLATEPHSRVSFLKCIIRPECRALSGVRRGVVMLSSLHWAVSHSPTGMLLGPFQLGGSCLRSTGGDFLHAWVLPPPLTIVVSCF